MQNEYNNSAFGILHSALGFAMLSLRDALESALVENPDDLATHHAYADFLQEQGDPRGEFIQLQLALEDPRRPARERQRLEARARELRAEHERQWLGILADELLGPEDDPWEGRPASERLYEFGFARGWLHRLVLHERRRSVVWVREDSPEREVNTNRLTLAALLCRAPEARLLRELVLDVDCGTSLLLRDCPYLDNLRVFQVGGLPVPEPPSPQEDFGIVTTTRTYTTWSLQIEQDEDQSPVHGWGLSDFLARRPRLEELYLLSPDEDYDLAHLFSLPNLNHLRILQVHNRNVSYRLEILADNPALKNLTHLQLHPAPSDDPLIDLAGVRALIASPHLPRLTHLQLHRSNLGDVGCTEIVTSGILKRLKVLDLRHGEITDSGARTLADCSDLRRLELLDIERNALTQTGIDALRRILGPALRADNQQNPEELAERQYLSDEPFA
jgi:uncharacterized protein (TIGR02996 family)